MAAVILSDEYCVTLINSAFKVRNSFQCLFLILSGTDVLRLQTALVSPDDSTDMSNNISQLSEFWLGLIKIKRSFCEK